MENKDKHENMPADLPKVTKEDLPSEINTNAEKPVKKVKRQATQEQLDHPLHGVKLVEILESLVEYYGWPYLAERVKINCFKYNPNMKSSLGFLRKMTWAREHVEDIYMDMLEEGIDPKAGRNNKPK